ncbi:hypothetical protein EYF80_052719 [Liparis tanakae]|uniref:Uncharacterized protein n=1 Tax=Liparis tanakae TaxID=230148 RepID=A0A4Z2F8B8_9TELE|nr:hypothetical protein EYF80_052719 [Liparis tanakae]
MEEKEKGGDQDPADAPKIYRRKDTHAERHLSGAVRISTPTRRSAWISGREMYDCEIHDCEMYDCEMYDCEIHDCEMYDCEIHDCEMYDCEMYDCEMYDCEMYDCEMYDCEMYDCASIRAQDEPPGRCRGPGEPSRRGSEG